MFGFAFRTSSAGGSWGGAKLGGGGDGGLKSIRLEVPGTILTALLQICTYGTGTQVVQVHRHPRSDHASEIKCVLGLKPAQRTWSQCRFHVSLLQKKSRLICQTSKLISVNFEARVHIKFKAQADTVLHACTTRCPFPTRQCFHRVFQNTVLGRVCFFSRNLFPIYRRSLDATSHSLALRC